MEKYLYCYSTTLYHFLMASGQRYICVGVNERTGKRFYLFEKTSELRALLDEYDKRKQQALS